MSLTLVIKTAIIQSQKNDTIIQEENTIFLTLQIA